MNEPFLDSPVSAAHSYPDLNRANDDHLVYLQGCHRIARLLRMLRELDESLAGQEELPEPRLSALVSGALQEAGFVDPDEGRLAIATVLELIGIKASATERLHSWRVLSRQ